MKRVNNKRIKILTLTAFNITVDILIQSSGSATLIEPAL